MPETAPFAESRRFRVLRRVMEATNPLMRRLINSSLAGPMNRQLLLLRYRGRRSGRTFTTPVGYVRDGDKVVMVTSPAYRWWPNFVGGADADLRLPEGWRQGRVEIVMPDDPRYDETVAFQVANRGPGMLRSFGVEVDDQGHLTPDAKATAATRAHMVLGTLASRTPS